MIRIAHLTAARAQGHEFVARIADKERSLPLRHDLSPRQFELLSAGGIID